VGAIGTRLSLRPLLNERAERDAKLGQFVSREGKAISPRLSSPAKAGDPVFGAAVIDPRGRSVLDPPHVRGMTAARSIASALAKASADESSLQHKIALQFRRCPPRNDGTRHRARTIVSVVPA